MSAYPKRRGRVDKNADQGSDEGWGSFAQARNSGAAEAANAMPSGYMPSAKNAFGESVSDGNVTQEMLDCGYNPMTPDDAVPQLQAELDALATPIGGFLRRNNIWDRN